MILVRTCGGGTSHNDERLKLLKQMVEYYDSVSNNIFKLHDHKGILTVYWFKNPSENEVEILNEAWSYLGEPDINHKVVVINEKSI
jgi:hypothetical protein